MADTRLETLIRTRDAVRKLARHGWRACKSYPRDEFGLYFERPRTDGRRVALLLARDGSVSVSAS